MRYSKGSFTTVPMSGLKGLPAIQQVLFLWICHHSNQEGVCWPSINLLAEECGIDRRTVMRNVKELEKKGFLAKRQRKDEKKGWQSTLYRVLIKETVDKYPPLGAQSHYPRGTESLPLGAQMTHELYSVELNPEKGTALKKISTPTPPSKKKRPYIEGNPAWQDPNDPRHWRVRIHTGNWVDYAGSVKDNLVWK